MLGWIDSINLILKAGSAIAQISRMDFDSRAQVCMREYAWGTQKEGLRISPKAFLGVLLQLLRQAAFFLEEVGCVVLTVAPVTSCTCLPAFENAS
jgi:hypothetical protein